VQERAGTDKRQALQLERQRKREVRDGTYRPDNESGSTTLANYMDGRLQARRGRGVRTVADDETRLRMHIVPHLGCKCLDGVTRRDVLDVIERLRSDRRLAPKTIRNVYGTLRTLFRDALLEELVTIDPCILPRGALPSPREMSPSATRRKPSVFSREEIPSGSSKDNSVPTITRNTPDAPAARAHLSRRNAPRAACRTAPVESKAGNPRSTCKALPHPRPQAPALCCAV